MCVAVCIWMLLFLFFVRSSFLCFIFLLSFLIHLIDIHAHLSTSQSLLIRTIGTILHNKITKLVYRRINCILYEYVWCSANEKKQQKKWFFFFHYSILFRYISSLSMARFETTWLHKLFSAVLLNFVHSALGFF